MKAAIIFEKGATPQYLENFPEPIASNDGEILISVKAAAIKNLDKSQASGKHYSTENDLSKARIPGGDGVGTLADGTRVFAMGISGMMAEKALVNQQTIVKLPDGIDYITAAALPNAVAGSAMALRFRAGMQVGETVLINGATGFTGKIAVQIAKYYGAKNIIVTGRDQNTLKSLVELGADKIITVQQSDEDFLKQLSEIHDKTPIDIVLDYLWGHSAELILEMLKGQGETTHKTKFVSVGSVAGDKIQLSSEILRSVDLILSGSGLGSWTNKEIQILFKEILPEMLQLAVENKLVAETQTVQLKNIEKIWQMELSGGKRLVVAI